MSPTAKREEAAENRLTFCGAAGTVTGAKFLIEVEGETALIDCGMFQGLKELRLRNWSKPPFDARAVRWVFLSHAHIDHSGYLPRLLAAGFRGRILCTPATADLLHIMLPDSAKLQEEEAAYANRKGYSKHHPALPLYTAEDAAATLERLEPIALGEAHEVSPHLTVTLTRAGHILGSACVAVDVRRRGRHTRILYSGDLGRYDAPVLRDPVPVHEADLLLVESTYGDRLHDGGGTSAHLERVVNEVAAQKGCLLIPSFAVGRTQDVLYLLGQLEDQKRIPVLPVYVDSPMATDVTEVYMRHAEDFDAEAKAVQGRSPLRTRRTQFVATPRESKALNGHPGPLIIISASGMATGGRVLHHLQHRLPEPHTTVLLVGYQAAGTRGRRLLEGAEELKMFGEMVPVRARVLELGGLSAHGDYNDILRWLEGFERAPRQTYMVHGEPAAAAAMAARVKERFGWKTEVAAYGGHVAL